VGFDISYQEEVQLSRVTNDVHVRNYLVLKNILGFSANFKMMTFFSMYMEYLIASCMWEFFYHCL
jgi:hypothetical protein